MDWKSHACKGQKNSVYVLNHIIFFKVLVLFLQIIFILSLQIIN